MKYETDFLDNKCCSILFFAFLFSRRNSEDKKEVYLSDEEAKKALRKSPPRQSYVLKLFDRSVDLSQFRDDSPLYPICRAWMANQPKANYRDNGFVFFLLLLIFFIHNR